MMSIKNKRLSPGDLVILNSKSANVPPGDYYDPLRNARGFPLVVLECNRQSYVTVLSPLGETTVPKHMLSVISKVPRGKK